MQYVICAATTFCLLIEHHIIRTLSMRKESDQMEASVNGSAREKHHREWQCYVNNCLLQLFVKCRQGVKLSTTRCLLVWTSFLLLYRQTTTCLCAFYNCVNSLDMGRAEFLDKTLELKLKYVKFGQKFILNKKISRPIWSVCEHGRTRNWLYIIQFALFVCVLTC